MLNETALRELADGARWGVLTTDTSLTITGWSRWMELHSALSAKDAIGRKLFDLFPEAGPRVERFYRQALDGQVVLMSQRLHGHILSLPPTVEHAPFSHMQQSGHIAPLRAGDSIVGTLTLIEDVSDRVVSEAELRTRAMQQAAIAVLSQRALVGGDAGGLFGEAVRSTMDVLRVESCRIVEFRDSGNVVCVERGLPLGAGNVPPAELARDSCRIGGERVPEAIVVGANERIPVPAELEAKGIASGIEVTFPPRQGFRGMLGVYATSPRTFTDDETQFVQAVVNVLALALDRSSLESELRSHVTQLADADRRKDEFLAMLAHELRNPLAPIRNAAVLLGMEDLDAETSRTAREIVGRQVDHMVRMVDDLLDVSRILRGKIELRMEPVELTSVMNRAVETSLPLIRAQEHQLSLRLPNESIWVNADAVRMAQTISNLLNNAAKYTDRGGRITLSAEREPHGVAIRVTDNGTGIEADFLPHVFDVFMQADRSIARSQGGLGVGLTLVRSLVQMHGGTVTAHSEGLGSGSDFTIRLPVCEQPRTRDAGAFVPIKTRSLRVLVVDDHVGSARILGALLTKLWKHDVRLAHDGPTAVQIAREFLPEVVILDIGLPGMSGYEIAVRIRSHSELADVLLVALTGYGQSDDRERTRKAGFDEHLVKPASVQEMQALFLHPKLTTAVET